MHKIQAKMLVESLANLCRRIGHKEASGSAMDSSEMRELFKARDSIMESIRDRLEVREVPNMTQGLDK